MDDSHKESALADLSGGPARNDRLTLNWPTRITLSRILLVVPFVACMLDINDPELSEQTQTWLRHAAVGIYLLMAVSDSLDGLLARRSGHITKLGAFLDPVADKLLVAATCLLLISQRGHVGRFIPPTAVVVVIVGKDVLLIVGFIVACLVTSTLHIVPTLTGKLATFVQLVMGAAVLLAPEMSRVFPAYGGLLSLLWWSAAGTAVVALAIYIRDGARYIGQ